MTELGSTQPIIIKKKVAGHGGHHGGAWKVAYADFVTAMMALFIVLWLMNANQKVQEAVGGYFRDPNGTGKFAGSAGAPTEPGKAPQKNDLGGLKDAIEEVIKNTPELNRIRDQVEMTVTNDGLRIELMETETGTFFESGSPIPSASGERVLIMLAKELGALPNTMILEGHTDSRPFLGHREYSNWELSTDRANAARRLMLANGLRLDQVKQVRGYADQHLRKVDASEDPSNRRISLIVQNLDAPKPPAGAGEKAPSPAAAPAGGEATKDHGASAPK